MEKKKTKQADTQSNLAKGLPSSVYVLRTAVHIAFLKAIVSRG